MARAVNGMSEHRPSIVIRNEQSGNDFTRPRLDPGHHQIVAMRNASVTSASTSARQTNCTG